MKLRERYAKLDLDNSGLITKKETLEVIKEFAAKGAINQLAASRQTRSENHPPMRQTRSKSKSMAISVADVDPSPSKGDHVEVMDYEIIDQQIQDQNEMPSNG